jgi:DNA-binding protein H-NS
MMNWLKLSQHLRELATQIDALYHQREEAQQQRDEAQQKIDTMEDVMDAEMIRLAEMIRVRPTGPQALPPRIAAVSASAKRQRRYRERKKVAALAAQVDCSNKLAGAKHFTEEVQ